MSDCFGLKSLTRGELGGLPKSVASTDQFGMSTDCNPCTWAQVDLLLQKQSLGLNSAESRSARVMLLLD